MAKSAAHLMDARGTQRKGKGPGSQHPKCPTPDLTLSVRPHLPIVLSAGDHLATQEPLGKFRIQTVTGITKRFSF